jgi:hypothetical protein
LAGTSAQVTAVRGVSLVTRELVNGWVVIMGWSGVADQVGRLLWETPDDDKAADPDED